LNGRAIALSFNATGKDSELFHEERSTITTTLQGSLALWVISNNHPGILQHDLRRCEALEGATRIVFEFGNPENYATFREEITLDLHGNGDISYCYFWGLPHGEFRERSGSRMKRI
jgi:hypothetical protein